MHPILFEYGKVKIYSFGLMLVIGLLIAIGVGRKRAPRYGITPDQFVDASMIGLLLGIVGARLVFILQDWGYYSANPAKLWTLQFEGITSFGGIIFGALGMWIWSLRKKVALIKVLDTSGGPFLLAHAVGRIGCLLNGCCFGTACTVPWGIPIKGHTGLFHPAQAYDTLMNIAAFFVLVAIEKRGLKSGQSFGLFLILHGLTRFIYEFWRAGSVDEVQKGLASSTRIPGMPITEAHVMAAALIILGVVIYGVRRHAAKIEMAEVPA